MKEVYELDEEGLARRTEKLFRERAPGILAEMRAAYLRRRDIALGVLRARGRYQYTPGGAFYVLVDISAAAMDSRDFAVRLLEEKRVAVAPGSTFGKLSAGAVRVSVASRDEDVREGVERICDFIDERKQGSLA